VYADLRFCESAAVLQTVGSGTVLVTSFGFVYVLSVFPGMLRRLIRQGVGGEVILRLYLFQELNKVGFKLGGCKGRLRLTT